MGRRKYKKESFKECIYVGEGEEDLRVILKRQLVRYINEQYAYPVIAIKEDVVNDYFKKGYIEYIKQEKAQSD
ncbi:hypothetical protein [Metabacillus indicus]|uniref:hypothetical protein n=1 Tax=Metabacillus indicus TaxID=246786 RepID=UPI0024900DA3|nr:hypothetical protein [Metabacillus indicus]